MAKIQKPLLVVLLTIIVDILGFGILIPIIPILLADPTSKFYLLPQGMTLAQGYILFGILSAIFPIMQFIASPILGQLSDKYGRKKILAISLAGTSVSYYLFAIGIITRNIPLLFFSRALDGATGGVIATAQATIADITERKDRVRNFALMGAAFGFGFIIGPLLGGVLSDPSILNWFNAATPFWFSGTLSLFNVLSVLFFLPETLKKKNARRGLVWTQSVSNVVKAFSAKSLRTLFVTSYLFGSGFTFFVSFVSVFLIHKFDFSQSQIGYVFAFIGVCSIFSQAIVVRRVAKVYPPDKTLRLSLFVMAGIITLSALTFVWWQFVLLIPFFSIFSSLAGTNTTGLISNSASDKRQGEVLGISASIQALAQAIPPILSGFIAAAFAPQAPMFVAAFFVLISALVFWRYCKTCKTLPKTLLQKLPP